VDNRLQFWTTPNCPTKSKHNHQIQKMLTLFSCPLCTHAYTIIFHFQQPIEILFNISRTHEFGHGEFWFAQPILIMVDWLCKIRIITLTTHTLGCKSTASTTPSIEQGWMLADRSGYNRDKVAQSKQAPKLKLIGTKFQAIFLLLFFFLVTLLFFVTLFLPQT
jgi:hypothetical protein